MKTNKKALTRTFAEAIFLALAVIIVTAAAIKIVGVERIFGSYLSCRWEIFSQGIGPERLVGLGKIPAACKEDMSRIGVNDLTIGLKGVKETINQFNLKYPQNQFKGFNPNEDASLVEFNLDKEMAKRMKTCADKVNKGSMPIFENWWHLYGMSEDTAMKRVLKSALATANKIPGIELTIPDEWKAIQEMKPPVFCVVCSETKFKNDLITDKQYKVVLKKASGDKEMITSLAEWMKKNPVPINNVPYFDYIKMNKKQSDMYNNDEDYYYPIDKPMAVVYTRVNIHQLVRWSQSLAKTWQNTIGTYLGLRGTYDTPPLEPEQAVIIMPYEDIGRECDMIIG